MVKENRIRHKKRGKNSFKNCNNKKKQAEIGEMRYMGVKPMTLWELLGASIT